MDPMKQESRSGDRYEQLYTDLLSFSLSLHERNRQRIRIGTVILLLLPVILGVIRWLTGSDKAIFLLIWVLCMFAVSIYLIGVEYLDDSVQKKLKKMTDREEDFGTLLPEHSELSERILDRAIAHRAGRLAGNKEEGEGK